MKGSNFSNPKIPTMFAKKNLPIRMRKLIRMQIAVNVRTVTLAIHKNLKGTLFKILLFQRSPLRNQNLFALNP